MQRYMKVVLLFVYNSMMTSFAMKSQKYLQMTNSTGAQVCSTDPPSHVLPMFPGGEARCGIECLMSSACPYYQFKSSTPMQCELYNQFPVNFNTIENCIGFRPGLPSILLSDCADVSKIVSNVSGVYTVYAGSNYRPLTVYCDMNTTSGGWTVVQRRKDGSVDFYRSWNNYARGFGDLNGEFWLGNDNLNLLTTAKRYKLRIDLADVNGTTKYAEYDNFVVQSSTLNYTMSSFGRYSGTAGNSLGHCGSAMGRQFATFDRDNDPCLTANQAVKMKGAWWFGNCCSWSHLNGVFGSGIGWYSWQSPAYFQSLQIAEMKIKPVN